MTRYWTCQRKHEGIACRKVNPARKRKCERCGKLRPPKRMPAHMRALEFTYEQYIELNGGREECGICRRKPSPSRKLDRDHDHKTGEPRGLLCHICNRTLGNRITSAWLRQAVAYLERARV